MKDFKFLILSLAAWLLLAWPIDGATLRWNANPEPDIAGYRVWTSTNGSDFAVQDVGNVMTKTVEVQNGVFYLFAVSAYNTAGLESDLSESVAYHPIEPGLPPAPVFTENGPPMRDGTNWVLRLAWQPTPANYGLVTYHFKVLHGTNVWLQDSTQQTNLVLTMPIFSPTFVHLWSVNANGASSPAILPFVRPGAPSGLTINP